MVGPDLQRGIRGGLYYERNGRKVYVKQPEEALFQARRSYQPTTGWQEEFPRKGRERADVYQQCDAKGRQCFLRPNRDSPSKSGFPICPSCRNGPCTCEPVCEGIISAYKRARQWGYEEEAERARQLEQQYHCGHKYQQKGGLSLPGEFYGTSHRFQQAYCPTPPPCMGETPVEYEMRGQSGKKCCRKAAVPRKGPSHLRY